MLDDVVKELASWYVFGDQVELTRSLDNFIQLDDVRVPGQLEDLDLPSHALDVYIFDNFVLFKDLHGHFFSCQVVCAKPDFAKSSLADSLANQIVANALRFVLSGLLAALVSWLCMMPIFGIRSLILFIPFCLLLGWPTFGGIFLDVPAYCVAGLECGLFIVHLIG